MHIYSYDSQRHKKDVIRIWKEIGWLEKEEEGEGLDTLARCARSSVAELEGAAESLVISVPGTLRYLETDLSLAAVCGVTTSRIARQQGLARQLTAYNLAEEAQEGAVVSVLGMFEQGFYNRMGYGTGGYEHWVSFDPNYLDISRKPRVPKRLGREDWKDIFHSIIHRLRVHGSCNLIPEEVGKGELLMLGDDAFGLGYYNEKGELTHHFYCNPKEVEHGPYSIYWLIFQNYDQFMELMALLKSLGDQVRLFRMREPRGIQFQDLIKKPLQKSYVSRRSDFHYTISAIAYWQVRILDLKGALALTHLSGEDVLFNLKLSDPIAQILPSNSWNGLSGEYVVNLGPHSWVKDGQNDTLPTLQASVGAFSRLWLGVLPARSLAVVDELKGPVELLVDLERILQLPYPSPDWDF